MVDLIDHFSCETVHQRSGGVPTLAEYLQEQEQEHGVCVCVCGGGGGQKSKIGIDGGWVGFLFCQMCESCSNPTADKYWPCKHQNWELCDDLVFCEIWPSTSLLSTMYLVEEKKRRD